MQKDIEKLQTYQDYWLFLKNLARKLELSPLKRSRPQTSKFVNTWNLPIKTNDSNENKSSNNQSNIDSDIGKPPKFWQINTNLKEGIKQGVID